MNSYSDSYIINLLLNLKEHHLFEDGDLFSHLKELADNFNDESEADRAREDSLKFAKFYRKNSLFKLSASKEVSDVPVRMYMDGVFDMVHSGHFNAIRQAKQLCDVLVIGVVSDEEVIHHKGPPVMNLQERVEIVSACKWVDEVATDDIPYNPTIELIDRLNCQYVAHGDDLALSADGTDCYSIIKDAGRMRTFKRTQGISTTDIVGRLLLVAKNPLRRQSMDFKRLSGDEMITSQNIENVVSEEAKEASPNDGPKVQLMQTTRRIRQFSSGKEPKPGDKIVYVDGTFDLLHVGHVRILKKAREQGDFLIVGLHDDETVEKKKGKNYPILHLQERVLNILALKYVDEVIIGSPWKITENLLKNFNISVVVEGSIGPISETEAQNIQENDPYEIPKKLGIYKKLESASTMTTETIIHSIIENRNKLEKAHEIKKKKLENYYKSQDATVKET